MLITIVLIVHLLLAIALVGIILLQRSEGGDLLGAGGSMSGFLTGRGRANLLTRSTAILAALFIVTSLALAKLAPRGHPTESILQEQPTTAPNPEPAAPAIPTAPVAR